MEDNDKNLEQFFNKKFVQNIEPEPWNIPDEDVWTGIESDIMRRKGNKRRMALLIPIFFLAIGIGASGYFYWLYSLNESKVKELQMQLEICGSKEKNAVSSNTDAQINFSNEKINGGVTNKSEASEILITDNLQSEPTILKG